MSIDHKGHEFGPDSEEIIKAVKDIDTVLKQFTYHLEKEGMSDKINLIVLSDHGMTDHTKVEEIRLSHYLTKDSMEAIEYVVDDAGIITNFSSPPNFLVWLLFSCLELLWKTWLPSSYGQYFWS